MEEGINYEDLSSDTAASPAPPPCPDGKQEAIEDPWHSRVLDVHRWSDHPEIIRVVTQVWDTHFQHLKDEKGRTGPKPKRSFLHQLRKRSLWTTDCLS